MSMYLEFEPHSWYFEFAIKYDENYNDKCEFRYSTDSKICIIHDGKINPWYDYCEGYAPKWSAFTDDGNTYGIIELHGDTLEELKHKIVEYWLKGGEEKAPVFYYKKLLKAKERYERLHN